MTQTISTRRNNTKRVMITVSHGNSHIYINKFFFSCVYESKSSLWLHLSNIPARAT